MKLIIKLRTLFALGLLNLLRVFVYRLRLRWLGFGLVAPAPPQGEFFQAKLTKPKQLPPPMQSWWLKQEYFGWLQLEAEGPPNWHANAVTGQTVPGAGQPWWKIPDFDPAGGDIKAVWEASRFDWVLAFAQQAAIGNQAGCERLNAWLNDWNAANPPWLGPNWKCGQEASIRVLHLAMAAVILGVERATEQALLEMLAVHLQRIAPTLGYAKAQDNNHGTSEAAALFIGGSWLQANGQALGARWMEQGRRGLEERVLRLIESDGSFSQYSLNYHRVVLDTLSMVEVWRQKLQLAEFSKPLYVRAAAATQWLYSMVEPETGDAPNLGANDGAHLLRLSDAGYPDFRPSVQLAMVLFCNSKAWAGDADFNAPLAWLGLMAPEQICRPAESQQFDQGGYAVLRSGEAMAAMRYPRFRFRPAQADALHLDFWLGHCNYLRDAGSYSYNAEARWLNYFPGTAAHNTIEFDGRDQMPRLSRFLFGDWLKTSRVVPLQAADGVVNFAAAYRDRQGASHQRAVHLTPTGLWVEDRVSGFKQQAILRWRLIPGNWQFDADQISDGRVRLRIQASVPIESVQLVHGWESRYYLQMTETPILEVVLRQPGTISTELSWAA